MVSPQGRSDLHLRLYFERAQIRPLRLQTNSDMVKKIFIFVLLWCGFLSGRIYAQPFSLQFDEQYRLEKGLANPSDFYVTDRDRAVVLDEKRLACALAFIDLTSGTPQNCHAIGRGPGEIAAQGQKVVTKRSDGSIWVSDTRGTKVYASDLSYRFDVRGINAQLTAPLSDTLVGQYLFAPGNALVRMHHLKSEREVGVDPIGTVSIDRWTALEPLRNNFMLRQGPVLVDDSSWFIGFDFSSHIIRLNPDGIEYIIYEPSNVDFPDYGYATNEGYAAPDASKHPAGTVDLDADDTYLYVLHHGRTFDVNPFKQLVAVVRGRIEASIEEWGMTDRLFVYEKATGNFMGEVSLPLRARAIEVTEEAVYILSNDGIPPSIIKYKKRVVN